MPDGQGGPRRSPEQTREQILDSATRFLSERPFRDLTVDRLMAGTAVGRGSFYVHFRSLHELAEVLLASIREEVEDTTHAPVIGLRLPAVIDIGIRQIIGVWERHGSVIKAISDAAGLDDRLDAMYRHGFVQRAIDLAQGMIEAAQHDGLVDSAIHAEQTATLLILANEAYLQDHIAGHPDADPEAAHRLLRMMWERTLFGQDITS